MAAVTAPELTLLTGEGDDMEAPGRAHPAWRGLEAEQGEVLTDDVSTYAARVGERLRAVRNLAGMSLQDVGTAPAGSTTRAPWVPGSTATASPPWRLSRTTPRSSASPSGHCCPDFPDGDAILCRYASRAAAERARETLAGIIPADSPAMITFAAIARSGDVLAEAAR